MNIKKIFFRGLVSGVCFCAYSFSAIANDTIRFTWEIEPGNLSKGLTIRATVDEPFFVNWGDNNSNDSNGNGSINIALSHTYYSLGTYTVSIVGYNPSCRFTYFSCNSSSLISLDVSNCTALTTLYCYLNSLSSLDVSKNTDLTTLLCYNNSLSSLDVSKNTALTRLECNGNSLTSLDVSKNTFLTGLYCYSNSLNSLDVSKNMALTWLYSYNNHIPLSDLYAASKMVSDVNNKRLGTQTLPPQMIVAGSVVDFSLQSKFGTPDTFTVFTIKKGNLPADTIIDYIIEDGIITFHTEGNYTVTMTNDAILSRSDYPAEVIVEFNVDGVGIVETNSICPIQIYPNPTTGKLTINNEQLTIKNVEIFDVVGCKLSHFITGSVSGAELHNSHIEIDISHLSAGMYFLKINNKITKIIKY